MATPPEFSFDAAAFPGVVRLFPLPNLVLFPHVVQPLHVFEERYRRLVEDALAGDRLITMAVLAPGWEANYEGRPTLLPVACLGRIATHVRLDDGRFNLLLVGLRRVRLLNELPATEPFRRAEAELIDDIYTPGGDSAREAMHARLLRAFKDKLASRTPVHGQLEHFLGGQLALGTLTDVVGYTLDFDLSFKLRLLADANVDRRAALLIEALGATEWTAPATTPPFPPDFSRN